MFLKFHIKKTRTNLEVEKLLKKVAKVERGREKGNFISVVFTREKKGGLFQTILNSKYLDHDVKYKLFKMKAQSGFLKLLLHKHYSVRHLVI